MQKAQVKNPWLWVPSLYFGQAIPYVVVMTLSVIMYKDNGISNTDIALYTSWLYLPWVIKPLWSPFVDMFRTKRVLDRRPAAGDRRGAGAGRADHPLPAFFQMSLAVLWLMAFSSATHDIAADGFYMLGLPQHQQAAFVGVRSTFYRLGYDRRRQGALVYLAGQLSERTGDVALRLVGGVAGAVGACSSRWRLYHLFILPRPGRATAPCRQRRQRRCANSSPPSPRSSARRTSG